MDLKCPRGSPTDYNVECPFYDDCKIEDYKKCIIFTIYNNLEWMTQSVQQMIGRKMPE